MIKVVPGQKPVVTVVFDPKGKRVTPKPSSRQNSEVRRTIRRLRIVEPSATADIERQVNLCPSKCSGKEGLDSTKLNWEKKHFKTCKQIGRERRKCQHSRLKRGGCLREIYR